jgi:ribosomal protein S18 acetylase RimI-like enzyme
VSSVLNREKQLKKYHPNEPYYYLWFIGVHPESQNQGIGSIFFKDVLDECDKNARLIYLETSVLRNLPWYEKFGFEIYRELPIEYKLYLMLRPIK